MHLQTNICWAMIPLKGLILFSIFNIAHLIKWEILIVERWALPFCKLLDHCLEWDILVVLEFEYASMLLCNFNFKSKLIRISFSGVWVFFHSSIIISICFIWWWNIKKSRAWYVWLGADSWIHIVVEDFELREHLSWSCSP